MNKETEPRPVLSLEQVTHLARETLLRDGRHITALIAEGSQGGIVVEFQEFGATSGERQDQMTQTGFLLAQQEKFGLLKQAFFIAEGWLSVSEGGKPPVVPPAQNPNRKKVMTISGLQV